MKTLKIYLAIALFSISSLTFANTDNPLNIKKELHTELVKLIGDNVPFQIAEDVLAEIDFTVNQNNEIVVIAVNSKNESFDNYIKNKLNYKKVRVKGVKKGEFYQLPVKIKKS